MALFAFFLILAGLAVLALGRRLSILGAAVGALLGVVLLQNFFDTANLTTQLIIVLALTLAGFFAAAFARGVVEVVILVLGTLAGFEIVLALLNLFRIDWGILNWMLAIVGAVVGLMMIRRSRRGSRDWGMIILAALVGAFLVTRGLILLLPAIQGTLSMLIALVLASGSYAYQGGYLDKLKTPSSPPPPAKEKESEPAPPKEE